MISFLISHANGIWETLMFIYFPAIEMGWQIIQSWPTGILLKLSIGNFFPGIFGSTPLTT